MTEAKNVTEESIIRILRSIDRRLALMSAREEHALESQFQAEVLRTQARTLMWHAIDGETGSPGLARAAGVSDRLAQMFVKELREAGFVRDADGGRGIEKDDDEMLRWFLAKTNSRPDKA